MVAGKAQVDPQAVRERLGARLKGIREVYGASAAAGRAGRAVQSQYAAEMDELIRALANAAPGEGLAPAVVCAVGGYGRRTLCLHSDIDLLIVFEGRIGQAEERFVNGLLQPLWDAKLTVGQHIREISDFDAADFDNPESL